MTTADFYLDDYTRTLFPLKTNRILMQHASRAICDFIYKDIKSKGESFRPQTRVYASKRAFHLRRTVKLDPVAEYFIYDIVYRNRSHFKQPRNATRRHFGYAFANGSVTPPTDSYRDFRKAVVAARRRYRFCVSCDIASYFNSLYHHDLVHWFRDATREDADADFLGRYLREINSGRSVDCLPQGIMPAKIIGSSFLRFVDDSLFLKSESVLRFMDDFYLFSDEYPVVLSDFVRLQMLLGEKGLSVNPAKTKLGNVDDLDIAAEIDEVKERLLQRRRSVVKGYDDGDEDVDDESLDEESLEYLLGLLKREDIEEEDAELVLAVMREDSESVLEHLPSFLDRFPSLTKSIYHFARHVEDKHSLSGIVKSFISTHKHIPEYQLFWLARLAEVSLVKTRGYGGILQSLYEHGDSTEIVKAKVLEIPEMRFGLPDMRERHLRSGESNWLAWASAAGSRCEAKSKRNHLMGYFANGGPINRLIGNCIKSI